MKVRSSTLVVALFLATTLVAVLAGWITHRALESASADSPAEAPEFAARAKPGEQPLEATDEVLGARVPTRDQGQARASVVREDAQVRRDRLSSMMRHYAETDGWEKTYSVFTREALELECSTLVAAITETTRDAFENRWSGGQYDVVSTDGKYTAENFNPCDVYQVRFLPNGVVAKSTLPEPGFEDVYKLKAQVAWLRSKLHAMPDLGKQ